MFFLFLVWIVFFDEVSVILWLQQRAANNNIEREIEIIDSKTKYLEKKIDAFKNSIDSIEKYAREYYNMKSDNEDVYIVDD
jgi:cell division protein FtsB